MFITSLILEIVYGLLYFQCAKYDISFVQKVHLKMFDSIHQIHKFFFTN